MVDLLRSLEWSDEGYCPKCGGHDAHLSDCRLDRAIRGLASSAIEEAPIDDFGGVHCPACRCVFGEVNVRDGALATCPSCARRVRMKEEPPADPSALAEWLYARVVPGQTIVEYRWGDTMRRQAVVTEKGAAVDIDYVTIDILVGDGLFTIPGSPKVTRLLNPDGTVLWEAK